MSLDSSSDSSSLSSSSACFFIDFNAFSLSFLSSSSLDSLLLSSSLLLFFCFLCFLLFLCFLCFFSFLCFLLLCLSSSLSLSSSEEVSFAFFFFFFLAESSSELSCFLVDLFFGEELSSSSESEASLLDFFFFSVSGDEDFLLTVLFSEDSTFFSEECLDFLRTCFSSSLSDSSWRLLLETFLALPSSLSSLSLSPDELLLDLDFTSLLLFFEGDSSSESSC